MKIYKFKQECMRGLLDELRCKLLPDQAKEIDVSLYGHGLARWWMSDWLLDVVERLQDAMLEHDPEQNVYVELKSYETITRHPELIWRDPDDFDCVLVED